MTKLLRRLLFFGLVFEALAQLSLPVLLTGLSTMFAFVVCAHLLLAGRADSA